ncbi:hypothetical protein C8Q78DRAFT_970424 [Trametes maxima]|nr:hypothetical protein C8Q78DRAFT_970424 [Trametes maxima]
MVDPKPPKKRRKASEDSDSEVVAVPGPPKAASKRSSARPEPATNGTSKSAVAKGKERADPPSKGNGANGTSGKEPEEQGDVMELDDEDEPQDPPAKRASRGGSKQPPAKARVEPRAARKVEDKLTREVESLRAQLEQSRDFAKERDKLAKQLEEVFRLRSTEAEQALEEYKAHMNESLQRKDSHIEELSAQLSKLSTSSKSSQSLSLHFLTREAAEEEKQALREENIRLKEVIKQRDATIVDKDKQIHSLQDEAKIVKKELDAEIERSKALAARGPAPAVARQQKPIAGEPRNTPVIRLYEDMTNVLVTSVKIEKSPEFPELDEEILSCIYTYQNPDKNTTFCEIRVAPLTPLNFTLRNVFDRPPDAPQGQHLDKDQLVHKVKYEPKDLDKENPNVVEFLAFFKDPFMFARDQMIVFLKTLNDVITGIFEPEADGEGGAPNVTHEVIDVDG